MNAYRIHTQIRRAYRALVPLPRLRAAIRQTLAAHQAPAGSTLTLIVTDDASVQQLNRQYRGVDAPTDILSFPAQLNSVDAEPIQMLPDELAAELGSYLGDLIIALPYTQRHAAELGHPLEDELVLLVVHGTLHLLGYDHDNAQNQARMWQKQAELLSALRVNLTIPHFTFGESHEDATD